MANTLAGCSNDGKYLSEFLIKQTISIKLLETNHDAFCVKPFQNDDDDKVIAHWEAVFFQ